jgi:hypothetical protein
MRQGFRKRRELGLQGEGLLEPILHAECGLDLHLEVRRLHVQRLLISKQAEGLPVPSDIGGHLSTKPGPDIASKPFEPALGISHLQGPHGGQDPLLNQILHGNPEATGIGTGAGDDEPVELRHLPPRGGQ